MDASTITSRALVRSPNAKASTVMICIPHAGAGPAAHQSWPAALDHLEVVSLRLPGRESRFGERPLESVEAMAAHVSDLISDNRRPLVLAAHSMGALVAFDVARRVPTDQLAGLVVSGSRAPRDPPPQRTSDLTDAQFGDHLRRLGGMPDIPAPVVGAMLEVLRSDVRAAELYVATHSQRLRVPLLALSGSNDAEAPRSQMERWACETTAAFRLRVFPGGHFFLSDPSSGALREIHDWTVRCVRTAVS